MDTRQETIKKIKSLLRFHRNGLTITDIAEKLRLNRNSTAKYLEILLISGEVNLNNIGPAKVYTYSQKMPVSAMLKFSADFILLIDNEMHILDANENALSILGTTRENLIGKPIDTITSPLIARLDIAHVFEEISSKGEVQREFSVPLQDEDHHFRIRLIPTVFDTMDEGITIIGEDITKQIQFEESLMISETRYRAIVQDLTYVICRWRPEGEITFINDLFSRFIGIPCNNIAGTSLFTYIVPEDLPLLKEKITRLLRGQPTVSLEIRLTDNRGTIRWYQWNIRGIYDHNGALVECQSVGRDINTEREQAQKIRESEERFHMITDHSPFPISIVDRSGNFLYVNNAFSRLFGYTREDIPTEKDWFEKAFPDMSARECHECMHTLKQDPSGSAPHVAVPAILPVTCKDGFVRQVNFYRTTLQNGEQFIVCEDLTPKKEAERLHTMLASIVNTSDDAPSLYRSLNKSVPLRDKP
ncbi:PAS domain-containing protein [Methanoregula sp. PtaB.Bin085]|uniref:PAS domain-containing protein n=1 Tax=Methanoregula sp. PtaB.Bin085 TaxID=1811680 RepID=UPI0025FC2565|nr:PAS domain-containing protein [Methanoregula sp. PtaB.Bin085]